MPHALPVVKDAAPTPGLSQFVEAVRSGKSVPNSYVILLGLKEVDSVRLLKTVQQGITYKSFLSFQRNLGISPARLLELVQIPQRTLTRRKHEGRLRPEESDRLLRVGRVFGKAIELFEGDVDAARQWLAAPQTVLGGAKPWDLAKTEFGSREVELAIGRIEHGVYA
jgi:putative toxin-antitoxin system antitoxin component (TIGR02293 family)